jgi:hypothetical protein
MTINGLRLPDALIAAMQSGILQRDHGSWQMRSKRDAFGNPLETELGELYDTRERIEKETAELPIGFEADSYYGESLPEMSGPGTILDILDFSKIVCFGISGDGAPFCLDFRELPDHPRIIWWNDVYWRVLAPDFESFLALFDLSQRD